MSGWLPWRWLPMLAQQLRLVDMYTIQSPQGAWWLGCRVPSVPLEPAVCAILRPLECNETGEGVLLLIMDSHITLAAATPADDNHRS
eukprot:CAMPEP_0174763958 /NCGR_PEP_ID=MMETSP1094-20130205/110541_1 /TAXON_ID=156173 /ORGANISM="Chrysochromulina brevifilum, Strain UTEX LB 985" /LENGTH=86 /DNA_ID=CAMNT_0015969913 /DNA_START=763 /DNA_END=1019 /DNA_ORIENTATION=+